MLCIAGALGRYARHDPQRLVKLPDLNNKDHPARQRRWVENHCRRPEPLPSLLVIPGVTRFDLGRFFQERRRELMGPAASVPLA